MDGACCCGAGWCGGPAWWAGSATRIQEGPVGSLDEREGCVFSQTVPRKTVVRAN